jgi:hypothetical protein
MILTIQNGKVSYFSSNSRQYDGEKIPGDLKNWSYFGSNPNDILRDTYDIISQRSTTLYHTHPPVASAINKRTSYAIGSGLLFRSQPDWEILGMTKEAAKDWGMRFQKLIHYLAVITNFYEKQSILYRTAQIMGDSLLFFDRIDNEMFDVVEYGGDAINFRAPGSTLGIKTVNNKKIGLFLISGSESVDFKDENGDQNVIQFYNKQMARQMRGFPLAYKLISQAKNNDRWWDATLSRAVMETMILGYSKDDGSKVDFNQQSAELANTVTGRTEESENTVTRQTGISDQVPGGIYTYSSKGGIEFTDLKTPTNNFDKMQNAYIDVVGMGTNTPPEVIMSRYSTSYTAHKGAFNDFIRSFMDDRRLFSNTVCKTFIIEAAKYLFLNKMIEMPNPKFFSDPIIREATVAGNYLGPVPGHINPAQEVQAKVSEVEAAFKLRGDVAIEYGNEYENMIYEWQKQEEEYRKGTPEQQAKVIQDELQKNDEITDENSNQVDNQEDNEDENNIS